jgi:hypothetical protein
MFRRVLSEGKTFLERVKTLYNKVPGLGPERIGPTVGQNSESRGRVLGGASWLRPCKERPSTLSQNDILAFKGIYPSLRSTDVDTNQTSLKRTVYKPANPITGNTFNPPNGH